LRLFWRSRSPCKTLPTRAPSLSLRLAYRARKLDRGRSTGVGHDGAIRPCDQRAAPSSLACVFAHPDVLHCLSAFLVCPAVLYWAPSPHHAP
ncbi:hypothetical protein CERSUDRAFT_120221, partial [Gelatoporia subvermispora B]